MLGVVPLDTPLPSLPSTVVCSIDKRHSYETALAYQEAGALARFVTGMYLSEGAASSARRLFPFGGQLGKRADSRLDPDRVVSMRWLELFGLAAAQLVGEHPGFSPLQLRNVLYDRRCTGFLDRAQAVHGFECTAAKTFEVAKQRGMRTTLDAPTVHQATWRRIVEEEVLPIAPSVARGHLKRLDSTWRRKATEIGLADRILVPSEWCATSFRAQIDAPERVAIAPYGTKVREGEPVRPQGKVRFLCLTSGLGLLKGTHHLLAAFAPLNKEAELWLAGAVLPELREHLAAYGDSVRVFGRVGPVQVQELFDQCHAFVFPSLCESSSLAVLEAMGQGLPVLVTERCGSPVADGVEGIVVPANRLEPLVEALARLRDPNLRLAMGARAKERARERTWVSYREAVRCAAGMPVASQTVMARSA